MAKESGPGVSFHDLSAGGETGRLIRDKDWTATSLGARDSWPRSLNNYLSMIFELPTAAIIFWGPDQVQLYNDGYSVIMGPRHPKYLGATFRECWPETYPTIHPWMQRVLKNAETVEVNRTLVPLARHGFTEEAYFTFSFSPLRDEAGRIAGILQIVTEVTDAVLGERRVNLLRELSNQTAHAKTTEDALRLAAKALATCANDLPFALLYVPHAEDEQRLVLAGSTGLLPNDAPFPKEVDLRAESGNPLPELSRSIHEGKLVPIEHLATRFPKLPGGQWPESPTLAVASPITTADRQNVIAVFVAGISPRLALDNDYQGFLDLVTVQLATLMAAARAYDDERKRAEALAEIDRTKTEFFSNVSHEFRTPLTLMLGPLEDALGDPAKSLRGEVLEAVHRNAMRLLRLVNSLLDFSRVEAGRLESRFEPTDLAVLTGGLAGSFQSLVESAGLRLRVDCPPLPHPIYVDRSQWEKIVLNLISNAFKFTFDGEIAVRLQATDDNVELSVQDSGTGIPADEVPRIFDRFHRVEGAKGRSFEGTGIGLALVQELARQHGGSVRVRSVLGEGSTFVVAIPMGKDHLPSDRVSSGADLIMDANGVAPFLLDATQWALGSVSPRAPIGHAGVGSHEPPAIRSEGRVLVADDNADMREYLVRLLSSRWTAEAVGDGQAALESALERPPDLVLSDVMMPRLDGVGLLRALRANAATSTIPVVLLSARTGEEAIVGGLETGADDYLVKPFSARELLSRVGTHLEMARVRRAATEAAMELAETRATLLLDLDRKNQELEAFSYSVSHDLRAPLRAIDGFSNALLEDYGAKLDDKAGHYLRRVRAATQRMGQLIDDLLELSRIGREPLRRERVNVTEVANKALDDLRAGQANRNVDAIVATDLTTQADSRLVAVILENLLANAWKFSGKRMEARIEVGQHLQGNETVFFVRDNGAGFDPEHAKKLFTPFQRLHSEAEFEGTGIGLATVQRVVSRHGGRIWAEATKDVGATFYFTLG